jgi:hypothetical protein
MKSYRAMFAAPPKRVDLGDVVDRENLDERRACVDCLYINILGINEGIVEWSPNDKPPSKAETLAWMWFVRPDLHEQIANDAPSELRHLIEMYRANNLEAWWREMCEPT